MATILYKYKGDGSIESCKVNASRVQDLLQIGWGVTNGVRKEETTEEKEPEKKVIPKEIREEAKKAGIPEYRKARIGTLMEKLGYEQSQD